MFVLVLMMAISMLSDARTLVNSNVIVTTAWIESASMGSDDIKSNEETCTLCEDFTAKTIEYFSANETQSDIISFLHHACSQAHGFKHQCKKLVDYYAPLFFKEIVAIQPQLFCEKFCLCKEKMISVNNEQNHDDTCTICHQFVSELLTKLQDPDIQFEIIETLLKECNKAENFKQECKKLVFEYGPIILANAEKFVETTDICAALHVCKAVPQATPLKEIFVSSA